MPLPPAVISPLSATPRSRSSNHISPHRYARVIAVVDILGTTNVAPFEASCHP
jgi:hypothetical protein